MLAKFIATITLLLCASPAYASEEAPISRVIKLLEGLIVKATEQGKAEETTYVKYERWCQNSLKDLATAIETNKENIEVLGGTKKATEEKLSALDAEIKNIRAQIAARGSADAKAQQVRDDEHALYVEREADDKATIAAIAEAIQALKDAKASTSAFMQKATEQARALAEALIEMRLNEDPANPAEGMRQEHVKKYAFKSGNVIELLKELSQMFEDQYRELVDAETRAANDFELAKAASENAMNELNKRDANLVEQQGEADALLATTKTDLGDAISEFEADTSSANDVKTSCKQKKGEWDQRTTTRTKELEAMKAAIGILSKASGIELKVQPEFVTIHAKAHPISLVQVDDPRMQAIALLRAQAKAVHSRDIDRLVHALEAQPSGPFDKVIEMVEKLIFRLMDEQKKEDERKAWCDQEVQETDHEVTTKTEKVEKHSAELKSLRAATALLTKEIADLETQIDDGTKSIHELDMARTEEKAEHEDQIREAQDAQDALAGAIAELTHFYDSTSLLSKKSSSAAPTPVEVPDAPATWGASYTGIADPKAQPQGIISVLQAVSEDFNFQQVTTEAAEVESVKDYNDERNALEKSRATAQTAADEKRATKERKVGRAEETEKALDSNQKLLDSATEYRTQLEASCGEGEATYAGRKDARTKEIEGLKEAQAVLAKVKTERRKPLEAKKAPPPPQ